MGGTKYKESFLASNRVCHLSVAGSGNPLSHLWSMNSIDAVLAKQISLGRINSMDFLMNYNSGLDVLNE